MVTDHQAGPQRNLLHRFAALHGLLLALLLLAGAFGHITSVWGNIPHLPEKTPNQSLPLLFPGIFLAVAGLLNLLFFPGLWIGRRIALRLTLLINFIATLYFLYLMHIDVPEHPLGIFLALTVSQVIVLITVIVGLTWPAPTKINQ